MQMCLVVLVRSSQGLGGHAQIFNSAPLAFEQRHMDGAPQVTKLSARTAQFDLSVSKLLINYYLYAMYFCVALQCFRILTKLDRNQVLIFMIFREF